jgi:hypothetical protein
MKTILIACIASLFLCSACHKQTNYSPCSHKGKGTIEYCAVDSSWFINMTSTNNSPISAGVVVKPINLPSNFQLNATNVMFDFDYTGDSTVFNCSTLSIIPKISLCDISLDSTGGAIVMKPVIYLYPKHTMDVQVQLNFAGTLTATYPDYNSQIHGWTVEANRDATLHNQEDGMEYQYLFWEGKPSIPYSFDMQKGYCVKGSDTKTFLQKTFSAIGLTPKEYNDMIVFWLPKMIQNKYNLIHFAEEEYTSSAPLTITPKPDAMLRVFMAFQASENYVKTLEPIIKPFIRKGFTVVEWGGTEVPKNMSTDFAFDFNPLHLSSNRY